ncbi:peroxisomal membrane protein PEX16-like [Rhagoletis pomonella]|uniref:peroxisomal membrane protein PEX16-like n=1 Tax=Rhagoletis pomonella TaxID=28610 RepID=UPI00177F50DB|nr:peroxisomal membrane protein PEX16-like [Rhagoletis pomonella]
MENLKRLIKSYEEWVAANPETVCDVETTTKWVSYFIAGRISDSNVVSELVYTLSNMLVLYNDRIIDKSRDNNLLSDLARVNFDASTSVVARSNNKKEKYVYRLKVMLTTLEYCEVLIEISAKRIFGNSGKWIFVAVVQFAKAAGRFFILKHSTEKIITTPALPALNRRALIKKQKSALKKGVIVEERNNLIQNGFGDNNFTFQLKRSGRVVRRVEGAPPLQYRDFKLPEEQQEMIACKPINYSLVQAEYLYIAKPLIHLAAMGVFGQKRWQQYVISLTLDLISIRMYHKYRQHMHKEQKLELSRRCLNLLLYLMRSPFFDRVTSSRLDRVLGFVADNVPLLKMVAGPVREYVPYWQSTYFYLWST